MRRLAAALLLAAWGCSDSGSGNDQPGTLVDGDAGAGEGRICKVDEKRCVDGMLRTCLEDGTGWLVASCGAKAECRVDACVALVCQPGERACAADGYHQCSADGAGFGDPVPCAEGESCHDGACLSRLCPPGDTACGDKVALTCGADGLTWDRSPCAATESCVDGACQAASGPGSCPAGEVLCGPQGIVACNADGTGWTETPCAAGQACFGGACVACVQDHDCAAGEVCADGACVGAPVRIATDHLPAAQVGVEYAVALAASGGAEPYRWELAAGMLPAGLAFTADGRLHGTPAEVGHADLTLAVQDAQGHRDSALLGLDVVAAGANLRLTTDSPLPDAEEGTAYDQTFEAVGGAPPYGFFVVGGALPAGLALGGDGQMQGTPTAVGPFHVRVRAVDAATPPAFAEADFDLTVTVAPLEVVGDQQFDLFVTKVVVLPTITILPNIPIPYDTQLGAKGGVGPYHWTEQPLPDALAQFVPMSGVPDGLQLDDDGHLHGAVADASQVIDLTIPFTMIHLTGFFFMAQVADTQDPAATASAIFLLPTLPIGM